MGTSKKSFEVSGFYIRDNEKQKEELLRIQKLLADDPRFYEIIWKFIDHPVAKELIRLYIKDDIDAYINFVESKKDEIERTFYIRKEILLEFYRYSQIWKIVQFSRVKLSEIVKKLRLKDEKEALDVLFSIREKSDHYTQRTCILQVDRYLTLKLTKKAKICEKIRELIVDCLGYYPTTEGLEIPVDAAAQNLAMAIISVPDATVPILLNMFQLYRANNTPRLVVREIIKKVMNFVHLPIPSLCIKIAFLALLDISKEPESKKEGEEIFDEIVEELMKEPCLRDTEALIMLPVAMGKVDHQLLLYCIGKGKFLQLREASNDNKAAEIAIDTARKNFLMKVIENKDPFPISFHMLGEYLGSSENPWTESQILDYIFGMEEYIEVISDDIFVENIPFPYLTRTQINEISKSGYIKSQLESSIKYRNEFEKNFPNESFLDFIQRPSKISDYHRHKNQITVSQNNTNNQNGTSMSYKVEQSSDQFQLQQTLMNLLQQQQQQQSFNAAFALMQLQNQNMNPLLDFQNQYASNASRYSNFGYQNPSQ